MDTISSRLQRHGVAVDGHAHTLIEALEAFEPDVIAHSPIAVVLQALDELSPAFLMEPGQARMETISDSRLLELITVMYSAYRITAESTLEAWLRCLRDSHWDPVRDDVQVVDLALGFVVQAYERRRALETVGPPG
ncbi:MAG: hypothetical protein AAF654_04030 [Myxococcota bacterium]